ncbi:MAG: signal peptidase [Lactobacillales bacterium]|jgi:cell fate regulator YaaT (PSP1 superfamily)|nr:signal peptidase [Lactobacillales bacterium]
MEVIGVCYKKNGPIHHFSPKGLKFSEGDYVIVRSNRGKEIAQVVLPNYKQKFSNKINRIIAKATTSEISRSYELQKASILALRKSKNIVHKYDLDLKMVSAEYFFDRSRLILSFCSESRIDFKKLLRILSSRFKTRVELRQIGVRDAAKVMGGVASCGRSLCCSTFLADFAPVSIKMAKRQDISLNPLKISGICGRLMCCLNYEDAVYKEERQSLPNLGDFVITSEGKGKVESISYLTRVLKIRLQDKKVFVKYHADEVQILEKRD